MKRHIKHWQDWVSMLVGVWMIAAPWVLGFDLHASVGAFFSAIVLGVFLFAFAVSEMFIPENWEEYFELYLGGLLLVSPWMLDFAALARQRDNAVACGLVVVLLALWVLAVDDEYGWLRRRVKH